MSFKKYIRVSFFQSKIEHNNTDVIIDREKDVDEFNEIVIRFCEERKIKI